MKPNLIFWAAFFILTGCSVGKEYIRPQASIPAQWNVPQQIATTAQDDLWWRHFNDPVLNELIEQRAVYNLNLQIAKMRVDVARADFALATAQLFPTISANALPVNGTGVQLTQLIALSTALDPDLFGRLKQNRQRLLASMQAEQANQQFIALNLYAEIAVSYLEFREIQAKNKLLRANVRGNRQLLSLLNLRYQEGYTNYTNVAQQEALIATRLAEIEQNKALINAYLHKIELLTGNNPGVLAHQLLPLKPIPQIKSIINLNAPSKVLLRRGDIIAAEREVAAKHASIRVAIATLFPQLNIGWLLGWQTETLISNIVAIRNPDSTLFATFNAPLLNFSLYRNIDLRKREKAIAIIRYQLTVMNALHEVETQYNFCQHYKKSSGHLKFAVEKKRLAWKLTRDSYEKGEGDFNDVLQIEDNLNYLEITYLHQLVIYQIAQINLYKALGGSMDNHSLKNK